MKEGEVFKQFEWPLIRLTLWIIIGAFAAALIINIVVGGYNPLSSYIFGGCLFVSIIIFRLFKNERLYQPLKLFLIFLIWATFNVSWFLNHGFTRSVIILFAFFFIFVIFVQSTRGIIISSVIMVINLLSLFIIESRWPELIAGEWNLEQERVDIIYTLIIGWLIIPAYIFIAKNAYVREYKNALRSESLKSSFLANMSHEIRTPLNAIMGFSEIIKDDIESRNNEKYLDVIYSNSAYLHELINQVLSISVIDSGNLKINKEEFSIQSLLTRIELESQMQVRDPQEVKVKFNNNLSSSEEIFCTDRTLLEQVFKNLIANAIKFTDHGEVIIDASIRNNHYCFSVTDTGRGISAAELPSVFDRFVKTDDQNGTINRGVGLGLYLCKRIVSQLGGDIGVESDEGKGSKFWFTIPIK